MLPLGAVYRDLSDFIRNKQATPPVGHSRMPPTNDRRTDGQISTVTETEAEPAASPSASSTEGLWSWSVVPRLSRWSLVA